MKVIEALKVIKDYCKSKDNCNDCMFGESACYITDEYPENWDVEYFKGFAHRKGPQVKIKLLEGGKMPTKGTVGSAGWDMYIRGDHCIKAGKTEAIPLGVSMELPEDYCAKILPRSSTGLNSDLTMPNSFGLVDSDFRGEVKAILRNNATFDVIVYDGMRVCQMLIEKVEPIEFVEVDELSVTERGASGYGSTGK